MGTGTEKQRVKRNKDWVFYAFAFGEFVFFITNSQIGRTIALCFIYWLVFVLFLDLFQLFNFPSLGAKTTREFFHEKKHDST